MCVRFVRFVYDLCETGKFYLFSSFVMYDVCIT